LKSLFLTAAAALHYLLPPLAQI